MASSSSIPRQDFTGYMSNFEIVAVGGLTPVFCDGLVKEKKLETAERIDMSASCVFSKVAATFIASCVTLSTFGMMSGSNCLRLFNIQRPTRILLCRI